MWLKVHKNNMYEFHFVLIIKDDDLDRIREIIL